MTTLAQRPYNTYDQLKVIALMAMTVDHVGMIMMPDEHGWRMLGRIAAPIFCFLVGYNRSYRFRNELLIAALMVSVTMFLFGQALLPLNILWSILFARVTLSLLEGRRQIAPGALVAASLVWLPVTALLFDYGSLVLLWALWGRAAQRNDPQATAFYGACATLCSVTWTRLVFDFSHLEFAIVTILLLGVFVVLSRFTIYSLPERPLLRSASRLALPYYVLHWVVILGLA